MLRLPVSGIGIALRAPNGSDELWVHEAACDPLDAGLELVVRLARRCDESPVAPDWSALTVTDFEFLLLAMRTARFGQRMTLLLTCQDCRAAAEISMNVADYLRAAKPRAVRNVTSNPGRPGWYCLDGAGFRLPTVGDQIAVAGVSDPARQLAQRCLDETARLRSRRARIERAMAMMAPEVSRAIAGVCPSCNSPVQAVLWVPWLVVDEFRRSASAIHDEVHLIARAYHWPEPTILSLPPERRRAYADRVRLLSSRAA